MTHLAFLALLSTLVAGEQRIITGTVRDNTGAAVARASVTVKGPGVGGIETTTDAEGRFTLTAPVEGVTLVIYAPGFDTVRRAVGAVEQSAIDVTLSPARLNTFVTVTAGRMEQQLTAVAASVSILDRALLDRSPAVATDDVLRQVPAFSLFRRSSSIAAHPTAQGVSLRGIGPSGVSRALVLLDGIPFNDPFGGWVAWSRVPRGSVDRIEVVEGSGASLFGNLSMGGAVNIITRRPARPLVEATVQYGERTTPRLDVSAGFGSGRWRALVDAGAFRTDGYVVLPAPERGSIDENVSAASRRVYAAVHYDVASSTTVHGRADVFGESRRNGKRSTFDGTPEANDTRWTSFGAGLRTVAGTSEFRARVFSDVVRFNSNFLAVPPAVPARSIGRMALNQRVPSSSVGVSTEWIAAAGRRATVTAGLDWRTAEGESREDALDVQTGTRVVLRRVSGGAQNNAGAFVQTVLTPASPVVITLAVRHDRWANRDGHNLETDDTGQPTANHRPSLQDRVDHVTTPRASALIRASSLLSVWTSAGWGFRAPTLNELYRQFRVGAVTTLANEALGPERLRSVEAGMRLTPHGSVMIRAAWFSNALRDAVSNVTLMTSTAATLQQRQNLGLTRVRGAQADMEWRPLSQATVSAAYIYMDAVVREFASNPTLVGKRLPQVPRHRGSLQLTLTQPRIAELTIAVNGTGRQFDDDLNLRAVPGEMEAGLPGFGSVDVLVSRNVGRGFTAFAGAQNVFNHRAFAGTQPTVLGAPRGVNVGLRWRATARGR